MLRQLALAHAEHGTLQKRLANVRVSYARRQLDDAKRFLRGSGVVPDLQGFSRGGTTFLVRLRSSIERRNIIIERYLWLRDGCVWCRRRPDFGSLYRFVLRFLIGCEVGMTYY